MRRAGLRRLRSRAAREGPGGARDDYDSAIKLVGGRIRYKIDALVPDGDMVAASWTGTVPSGAELKGLSVYRVSEGMLRSTRHALIGDIPR